MSGVDATGLIIRDFAATDQQAARNLILAGLAGRFGFLDERLNQDLNDIRESYVTSGGRFLVAEDGGAIIATGALSCVPGTCGRCGRLERISVDAAHRRRGIARRIANELIHSARDRGMTRLLLETEHDWHDAISLYTSLGFREVGRDGTNVHFRFDL